MLELMEEYDFEKISVKKICDRAEINRSTFYAHYEDTRQLITEIEDRVLNQFPKPLSSNFNYSDEIFLHEIETFCDYVKENRKLFRILLIQHNSNHFNTRLIEKVMKTYQLPINHNPVIPEEYSYMFSFNGSIGIIRKWIESDFAIPSKQFAKIIFQLVNR